MGMLGWKYFWAGSKTSYTSPCSHLPLIRSVLEEYGPDSHPALPVLLPPKLITAGDWVAAQIKSVNLIIAWPRSVECAVGGL